MEYGRLDPARRTWTDETGHTMDLSLGWQDCEDRVWTWAGGADPVNGPFMSAGHLTEPLDLVLAMWGPIRPVPHPGSGTAIDWDGRTRR